MNVRSSRLRTFLQSRLSAEWTGQRDGEVVLTLSLQLTEMTQFILRSTDEEEAAYSYFMRMGHEGERQARERRLWARDALASARASDGVWRIVAWVWQQAAVT